MPLWMPLMLNIIIIFLIIIIISKNVTCLWIVMYHKNKPKQ